ncbi:MAG: 23S rRNA (adenine(2503)-C(2))-methyltransferase RlmN [Treponema sp.]|nr:23S rRNA (adenine(2503)-C(2))-methyltransferase RlmN [Treponema sp.]
MKIALAGLTLNEIKELLPSGPQFRASQIFSWVARGITSFEEMTNIPLSLQNELKEKFCLFSSNVINRLEDGQTKKIVLSLKDEAKIESVLLSDGKKRLTACISTQVGCPAGCVFCKTGSLGFKRNLDCAEIVEQFLHLRNEKATGNSGHIIDNIVVMGMGEPLLNLPNLRKAILILNDKKGINFSLRRITISTCGICGGLFDLAQNGPVVRLALSLTTADEPLRRLLMPVTNANPLEKVKEYLLLYQRNGGGRITLEVPLFSQINCREKDADSIAEFAKGLDTVINIIPWNPVAELEFNGKPLAEPSEKEVKDFIQMLESRKLKVTKRLHKGRSVMGACGQLG